MNNTIQKSAREYVEKLLSTPKAKKDPLPSDFDTVVDAMAESSHEKWRASKVADGYVWGNEINDKKKTHNLIVPYPELPDEEKAECRRNAIEAIELILESGCRIGRPGDFEPLSDEAVDSKVDLIVEALHDAWAATKARKGYVYSEERNDDPAQGDLTHRDMLPFRILMEIHPEDAMYDKATAIGALNAVKAAGYIVGV